MLLNTTLKISIIVAASLAVMSLLRHRSAAVRHFVLAVALAGAAATPFVRSIAPDWQPAALRMRASRLQVIDRPLAVFDDSGTSTPSTVAPVPAGGSIDRAAVMRGITIIWLTGVVLALAVLAVGLLRLSWIAARARRLTSGPWVDAADDIARAYGLRETPVVLHGNQPSLLGTWGVMRAKVLLPVDALDWPADRIRVVLGHELAHVRRGDWIVQIAVEVLCAAYWFNPLVWIAARRLRLESEQACDDAVLTMGVEGSAYATELVDLARAFRNGSHRFVPAAAIARPSSLERRVRAMLNVKLNRDPITRSASIAAGVVLAAVTVLVAGFGVSAQGQFGGVAGTVLDQNNRPIPGVRLVLSNAAAQTKSEVKSDANGYYQFVGVQPGTYELMFESLGMAYLKREGLNVPAGGDITLNATLRLGSLEETITVSSASDGRPLVMGITGPRPADKPDPCAQSTAGGCIRPPVKLRDVRPVYPPGSDGGPVELNARIDANGDVANISVVGSADPVLAEAAITAVRQWEFTSTHLDGQPIEVMMHVHVNFQK
ncbi:MAG TPA: M56 family metallopeptidase [Vicinamibacterales bacterium]|nr:M56 family metallopeptidase [Vicinamibacterales bacterium]